MSNSMKVLIGMLVIALVVTVCAGITLARRARTDTRICHAKGGLLMTQPNNRVVCVKRDAIIPEIEE